MKERLLVKHSRYFAEIFGSLTDDIDTMVLRHGKLKGEDGLSKEAEEEPLANLCYATMSTIVDFMETGVLGVGEQNVRSLLYASDVLAIGSVETACFNFLKANLNPANCVRHFVLADEKRSWSNLSSHCALFIQLNFDELRKLTQVYQHTTAKQFRSAIHHVIHVYRTSYLQVVTRHFILRKPIIHELAKNVSNTLMNRAPFRCLISDECLNVAKEEMVLESALEWVNYDVEKRMQHLPSLLTEVQWPLVRNKSALKDALKVQHCQIVEF